MTPDKVPRGRSPLSSSLPVIFSELGYLPLLPCQESIFFPKTK